MKTYWFLRSGKRTTESKVRNAKDAYAQGKRTGKMGDLACSVQPSVADRVDQMTPKEFALWSGQYVWKEKA